VGSSINETEQIMKATKPSEKQLQITLTDSRVKTVNLGKLHDSKIADRCAQILAEFSEEYVNAEVHLTNARLVRSAHGLIIPGYWTIQGQWIGNKGA
jgi:hypothetical protein